MSLATRCPHCSTIFKVVQDQLKMSGGWVRCGRCNQPFNALETLFDMAHEAPPPRQDPRPEPRPEAPVSPARLEDWPDSDPGDAPREAPGVTSFELDLPPAPDRVEAAMASLLASAPTPPPPTVRVPPAPMAALRDGPSAFQSDTEALPATQESDALDSRYLMPDTAEQRPAAVRRRGRGGRDFADAEVPADWHDDRLWNDTAQEASGTAPTLGVPSHATGMPSATNLEPEVAPDEPVANAPSSRPVPLESETSPRSGRRKIGEKPVDTSPTFIREAERKALWRSPWVRGLLAGLSLALTLLLGAQLALHHRDTLAERVPALAPALTLWCEHAGCRMGPVRDIESLQVDSISLVRASSEGPDMYRLVLNMRNHAPQPRAWPSVDLTLTDANGVVLGRRLFDTRQAVLPAVGKTPAQPLPPAVPANGVTTVQWRLQAPDLQLASYTVELFYP